MEGEAYNSRLILISKGDVQPTCMFPEYHISTMFILAGSIPVETILSDLWSSMRRHDEELAKEVMEPTFLFMRAQTDKTRLSINTLGRYLEYREKDVGQA